MKIKDLARWKLAPFALVGGVVITLALGGASCESRQDAGVSNRDTGPADLINMPDGYSNVAHKCDGPNMVYVIYHGTSAYGSVAVVANDPRCTGVPGK